MKTLEAWENDFLAAWPAEYSIYWPKAASADAWDLYDLAYAVDANTAMWKASGRAKYLRRAIAYTTEAIRTAKPSRELPHSQFHDDYLGWANHSHPSIGDDGKEYPLFESYLWRYVTALLVAMRERCRHRNGKFTKEYADILAFTETHIFEKWKSRGVENLYRSRTHMASHWARICLDLSRLSRSAIVVHDAQAVVDTIDHLGMPSYGGASLMGQMRLTDLGFVWSAEWGKDAPAQDTAHGNAVVGYIVHAFEQGYEWGPDAIARLVYVLKNVIWPTRAEKVDGTGAGTGWYNDGLLTLGRFDADLQALIENHNIGRNTQLYGNGALNAAILSGAVKCI